VVVALILFLALLLIILVGTANNRIQTGQRRRPGTRRATPVAHDDLIGPEADNPAGKHLPGSILPGDDGAAAGDPDPAFDAGGGSFGGGGASGGWGGDSDGDGGD
jgi:uncharacterized membrane protein YgcG